MDRIRRLMHGSDDFFHSRIDQMIDLRRSLAVLATHMPWQEIEASLAKQLAREVKKGRSIQEGGSFWFPDRGAWCGLIQRASSQSGLSSDGVVALFKARRNASELFTRRQPSNRYHPSEINPNEHSLNQNGFFRDD
jgi:hypothetical protein